jgi:GAF domain-containing protein
VKLSGEFNLLAKQLASLLEVERNMITNLSQFSALVFNGMGNLNWAGFYLTMGNDILQLGPFQGQVACTKIPLGKGVCGSAAAQQRTLLVDDVNRFDGHIACDSRSQSELVCPIVVDHKLVGVFDIDSPLLGRFNAEDQRGIESLIALLIEKTDWKI